MYDSTSEIKYNGTTKKKQLLNECMEEKCISKCENYTN